jgi:hypothetical protein
MKTTPLLGALALLTATSLWASEQTSDSKQTKGLRKVKPPKPPVVHQEKKMALTGSYIKGDVRRQGVMTDGPLPVYVLDQKAIDLTGAADLAHVLVHTGFRR